MKLYFRSLALPHGLEQASVVHQLDPAHHWEVGGLIIGFLMANMPYLPNFKSLAPPHGLDEAPMVHQLDPGDLWEVGQPHHWLSHGQFALPT